MGARTEGERWKCSCGEELIGARTLSGGVAPITLAAKPNGNVWLGRDESGRVISAVIGGPLLDLARETGLALHLNHFADCPDRDLYRRTR